MSPKKKLNDKKKEDIIKEHKSKGTSQRNLANKFAVSKTTVQRLIKTDDGGVSNENTESESILF